MRANTAMPKNIAKPLPTQDRLIELLSYDEIGGTLTWKKTGLKAGWHDGRYIKIIIDGSKFYAHRIVWKMKTREEPKFIDHENLDRSDLRWENIRNGTKGQNQGNRNKRSDNTSGFKNIHWCDGRQKWVVQVHMGRNKMMRRCKTLAGAIAFQRYAAAIIFGRFARAA